MIAVAVSLRAKFGHQIADGVARYGIERGTRRWRDIVHIPDAMLRPGALAGYHMEGLIAAIYGKAHEDEILALGIPAVNVSSALRETRVPCVRANQLEIGALAAKYFLERGYRNFVYALQWRDCFAFAADRGLGFMQTVHEAGGDVSWHGDWPEPNNPPSFPRGTGTLIHWIAKLPKPIAIFTCHDYTAADIYSQLLSAQIAVPEQVAILGVGDEYETHYGERGISSIETPFELVGYHAAAALESMLDGEPAKPESLLQINARVVTRASTDAMAADDAEAVLALRYIRENACKGIDVEDVLAQVPLSRRSLERRFRAAFGRTIKQDILRNRIEEAQKLLAMPHLSVSEVATACGFGDRSHFFVSFRTALGVSPSEFRKKRRGPSGAG
jgi:LacI family transcriptional regulator